MSCCVNVQLFAILGFIVSAIWINTVASEVVNVLHLLGVVFRLSSTVLGLTLLAWGNSIGGTQTLVTVRTPRPYRIKFYYSLPLERKGSIRADKIPCLAC